MGGRVGPDLAERSVQLSLSQFATAMWNKAPAMTAAMKGRGISIPQLPAEKMADLVAYLYSARYFARRGDPTNGTRLAATRGCLNCHALYGERGKVATDLSTVVGLESPAKIISSLWNHSFIDDARSERSQAWRPFRAEEMADLVAFLQGLRLAKKIRPPATPNHQLALGVITTGEAIAPHAHPGIHGPEAPRVAESLGNAGVIQ